MLLQPVAPVAGALLGQQHVHQLVGVVRGARPSAAPGAACAGSMVVSRSCAGFISPRPLKRVTTGLARLFSAASRASEGIALGVVERVDHLLAGIDAVQRRHGDEHMAAASPAAGSAAGTARTAASRCAARRNRRRRGCRSCGSAGPRCSAEPGSTPMRDADVVHFLRTKPPAPCSSSQVFRILPRSGMMAWKSWSRACLAEPPAESPSTRNSSERAGSWLVQSASLPGSAGPGDGALARDALRRLQALLRVLDGELRDALAGIRMLVEPQRRWRRAHSPRPAPRPRASRAAPWSGRRTADRCILIDSTKQTPSQTSSGVELHAARQQVAELAELAHRVARRRRAGR